MNASSLPTHVALRLAEHEHALRTEARHQAVHAAEHRARRSHRRHRSRTRSLLTLPLVVALALAALVAGVGPASAGTTVTGSAGEWQDGRSDHDTIPDPITGGTGVGVSANVGWRSDSGQVPKVGEVFYVRGYAGLVTVPWSGEVAVLPELMLPNGVVPADDVKPIRWALGQADEAQEFSTRELTFDRGANGGFLIGTSEGQPWTLRRGDVMEIQVPVRATRELKGPATQRPECQSRIDGTAPCPIGQSGDHLQIAFTVGGHSGDKQYVTPYVGLFAQQAAPASSTTTATYTKAGGAWKASVTVRADGGRQATGGVQVRDNGRTIARGTVGAGGKVTVRLPRLKKGKHTLSVKYAGSSSVSGSTSRTTTVTVR